MNEYRFFAAEITGLVLYEQRILDEFGEEGQEIVFKSVEEKSKLFGKIFPKKEFRHSREILQKILSAMGFGISFFKDANGESYLYFSGLLWATCYKNSKLPYLGGFISGFLKGSYSEDISIELPEITIASALDAKFKISYIKAKV